MLGSFGVDALKVNLSHVEFWTAMKVACAFRNMVLKFS